MEELKAYKVDVLLNGVVTLMVEAESPEKAAEEARIYMSSHHKLAPYSYKIKDIVGGEKGEN